MIYKNYAPKYEKQVVKLLNICFEGKKINSISFRWKHFDSFFGKREVAMVALDAQKVCAFVCFTPVTIKNKEAEFEFYSCSVQATHPDYRRRGIVSCLTQIIENKLSKNINYFGFSNKDGVQIDIHSKRIGYNVVGQMSIVYVASLPTTSKIKVVQVNPIKINESVFNSSYLHFQKDANYISWRYLSNPKNKYVYYEIFESDCSLGYVIAKKKLFNYDVFDILTTDVDNTKKCVNAFCGYAFKTFAPICTFTYLPNIFWDKVFPKLSVAKKLEMYFTVKSKNIKTLDSNNWLIQGGDVQ